MSMKEEVAYLKGLADGKNLGDSDVEVVLKKVIDVLGAMAATVDDVDDDLDVFCEQLDAVDEDLADLEECVYDEGILDDEDFDDYDADEELYDVTCPSCGEEFKVDGETVEEGSVECPNCKATLDFDFDFDEDEDEE